MPLQLTTLAKVSGGVSFQTVDVNSGEGTGIPFTVYPDEFQPHKHTRMVEDRHRQPKHFSLKTLVAIITQAEFEEMRTVLEM